MINRHTSLEKVEKLTHACRCPRCEHPCHFGSGAIVEGQLKKIADFLNLSEDETKERYFEEIEKFGTKRLRPKLLREDGLPYGRCVFYDNGCSIHPVKPLECSIAMGCKPYGPELITWFMLNYYLDEEDPESLRQFRIYLEADGHTLEGAEFEDIFDEDTLERIKKYEDKKGGIPDGIKQAEDVSQGCSDTQVSDRQ